MLDPHDQRAEKGDWNDVRSHSLSSDPKTPSAKSVHSNKEYGKTDSEEIGRRAQSTAIQRAENSSLIDDALLQNCKNSFDLYCSKSGLLLMIDLPQHAKIYTGLKNRNVKIRVITEITEDNLRFCKQIMDIYSLDLKHLEGTEGVFAIADNSLYITASSLEDSRLLSKLIYSNVKGIINQNKFLFENLWIRAIPAEQRIREIEEKLLPIETKILDTPQEILTQITNLVEKTEMGVSICSPIGGFQLLDNLKPLFQSYKGLIKKHTDGKVKGGIRWITHIEDDAEQVTLIKKFLDFGIYIRHIKNIPSLTFGVSERQFQSTIEEMIGGKMIQSVLHSTNPSYIQHYQSVFERLWNSAIDAKERIRQIEEGTISEVTSLIENSHQSKNLLLQVLEEAQKEIMIIFPSLNSLKRQSEIGLFNLLKLKNRQNFRIRILSPSIDIVKEILILEYSKEKGDHSNNIENIAVREIEKQQDFRSTILMADKKYLLTIEVKDDTKETFEDSVGLTTYSTSRPTVLSYISIFESLWSQTETSDNLRIANERIVKSEEMEREFINTAAHELRTPTQAIMGYIELDFELFDDIMKRSKVQEDEGLKRDLTHLHNHFDAISRNSARLDDLINNLLDVARIESNRIYSLQLHKERLDLIKEIKESINTQLDQKIKNKNIQINFINQMFDEQLSVYADISRLNQILNNLIDNAIKFSPPNSIIDIIIKDNNPDFSDGKAKDYDVFKQKPNNAEVLVGISDRGKGISPKIMPKLFEKFMTDSDFGTGLGLYITKNLVEAHGGKIWAFNNNDGLGSTFVFSLPKIDNNILNSN